ncbi:hypothetical protein FB45DRAFT_875484 [Roridomyces roridus]|uniref:Uncharacterized protein n=1 Tax=Roridomyces roridus TaxID=1738132 RepID=A0AAD7F9Z3_9AGAR|nr:hypothetical protein FB45DRAFT_875484 [Roridomyces roridus]
MPHLTSLTADPLCVDGTYLQRAGHSLQSIRAIVLRESNGNGAAFGTLPDVCSQSPAQPLKRLLQHTSINLTNLAFSCFATEIPDILSCLPASDRDTITVYLQNYNYLVPWTAIDTELSHERFQRLRSFAVLDFRSRTLLTKETRHWLPEADARRILDLGKAPYICGALLISRENFKRAMAEEKAREMLKKYWTPSPLDLVVDKSLGSWPRSNGFSAAHPRRSRIDGIKKAHFTWHDQVTLVGN